MSKLPEPHQPEAALPAVQDAQAVAASPLDEAPNAREADRTVVGTVLEVEREFIWIETESTRAKLYASELMLGIGEVPTDRYAPGDRFEAFVFQMGPDPESGGPQFSIRRAAPYPNALSRFEVGSIVTNATVVNTYDLGVELDVDGVRGNAFAWELPLARDESTHDRYEPGDTVHDLFVWDADASDTRSFYLSVRRNASGYNVGDIVSGVVSEIDGDGELTLDINGVIGYVDQQELSLADSESIGDRYAVGDVVEDLLVWVDDHDARYLDLSVRRNAPGYVEAFNAHSVGDVVSGIVTILADNGGLTLDINSVIGYVDPQELSLADSESIGDRYAVGDVVEDLLVWDVDHDARHRNLSVRRNAPGYVEALNARSLGEVVSGVVTEINDDGGLTFDIDGVIGYVDPQELSLADSESIGDRYAVGDVVEDLLVLYIDPDARHLNLSVRRNAPGYVEALNAHSVGEVVSASVTLLADDGGLWLHIGGVVGVVAPEELSLADGESVQDYYAVGDTVHGLFVWQVNHDARDLSLSVRRNVPGYVEALADISVGAPLTGIVVGATKGGLWLRVAGVIGWISTSELQLDEGDAPQERYTPGDTITARVWQIDREVRDVILSVRRLGTDSVEEPIGFGVTIDSVVREVHHGAIRVLVASQSIRILMCELSLGIGEQLHFKNGDSIPVVVLALDGDGNPSALSHRRALPEWQAAMDRLAPGVVVPDAQVVPKSAVPENEDRAVVDLGPVNGFVRRDELDAKQAEELMVDAPNTQYPVVVDEINEANVIVSRARFEERWQELAEKIAEGDLVDAEFRRASRDSAIVDLGFGLLAEMPLEQLPTVNDAGEQRAAREGDTFKVRITRKEDSAHLIKAEIQNQWLVDLIAGDESLTCEFKAVFKGPKPAEPSKNREVYSGLPVLRAMAGLMNRDGGHVLVGITDTAKAKGNVIGWEASGFKSQNDLTTTLSNLVGSKLTPVAAVRYEPRFEMLPDGREILDIDCEPADRPVFLKDSGSTEFLVRQPAETKPLDAEEQHDYIQKRFYGVAAED